MRPRLVAVFGLIFALGCACADFQEGFDKGASEGMVENFQKSEQTLLALPDSPARKRMLDICSRGQRDSQAGKIKLIEGSVFLGELEAALSDGDITDAEADTFTAKYEALVAG